jgi:hypothetical protein
VSLKFTSATKLRAFCSIPSSDLLKLVKSLDGVSSSELKEIAGTKIGKVLTYNQLKDLKTMAGDIKLSHINSLKSQMCKNEDTNAGEEEDEEVEDEG